MFIIFMLLEGKEYHEVLGGLIAKRTSVTMTSYIRYGPLSRHRSVNEATIFHDGDKIPLN